MGLPNDLELRRRGMPICLDIPAPISALSIGNRAASPVASREISMRRPAPLVNGLHLV